MLLCRFIIIITLVFIGGCSSFNSTNTGFLDDYENFAREPNFDKKTLVWQNSVEDRRIVVNAKRLYIYPVTLQHTEDVNFRSNRIINRKASLWVQEYFDNALKENLGTIYTLVDSPEDADISIKVAMTRMGEDDDIYSLRDVIPAKLAFRIGEYAIVKLANKNIVIANAAIEMEIVDNAQQRCFAMVSTRESNEEYVDDTHDTLQAVGALLDEWTAIMVEKITIARIEIKASEIDYRK